MPPKRKASTTAPGEPVAKQRTRSSTRAAATSTRTTRSTARPPSTKPAASTSKPTSPRKRSSTSATRGTALETDSTSLKENGRESDACDADDTDSSADELNFTTPTKKAAESSRAPTTIPRLIFDSVTVPHLSRPSTPTTTDDNPFQISRPRRTYGSPNKRGLRTASSHPLPTPTPTASIGPSPARVTRASVPEDAGVAAQQTSPAKPKRGRQAASRSLDSDTLGTDPLALRRSPSPTADVPRLPTPESPTKPRAAPQKKQPGKGKARAVAIQDDASDAVETDIPRTPSKPEAKKKFPVTPLTSRLVLEPESSTYSLSETPTSPRKRQQPVSPFKTPTRPRIRDDGVSSPIKGTPSKTPSRKPKALPPYFTPCLQEQKMAMLAALQNPLMLSADVGLAPARSGGAGGDKEEKSVNREAFEQLQALLKGTVERGEGNSCMIIGPRGSGKTKIVEHALRSLETDRSAKPIIIRLSGHAQHNDRLAMREIAWQLAQEVHSGVFDQFLNSADDEKEHGEEQDELDVGLPASAHLPALIGVLPTLKRPVVVVLDAFDLFALHPRQSLLYCLLDTVQASYGGSSWIEGPADESPEGQVHAEKKAMGGLAVVGVTTRVDTLNLLEKRVKSRFSGRMIRTAGPTMKDRWLRIAEDVLTVQPTNADDVVEKAHDGDESWEDVWTGAVEMFLTEKKTQVALGETYALTRDVNVLLRILTHLVLNLTPANAFPSSDHLLSAIAAQRCPSQFSSLHTLSYPAVCLLIAAVHTRTSGHDVMTFEMLHDLFRDQVRTSLSAPVMVEGGGIGMVRCKREVMAGAFECLVSMRVFAPVAPPSAFIAKEFVKYRCTVDREDIKRAVERIGQTNLKRWLLKAGEVR